MNSVWIVFALAGMTLSAAMALADDALEIGKTYCATPQEDSQNVGRSVNRMSPNVGKNSI
jgi:hypothetical protein